MKNYIETLSEEMITTKDWTRQFEIIGKLRDEFFSCQTISEQYNRRITEMEEYKDCEVCTKCQDIIDHEQEIMGHIQEIFHKLDETLQTESTK